MTLHDERYKPSRTAYNQGFERKQPKLLPVDLFLEWLRERAAFDGYDAPTIRMLIHDAQQRFCDE